MKSRLIIPFAPILIILLLYSITFAKPYVNQIGYNLNESKGFTSPGVPDGTIFWVKRVDNDTIVYTGTVKGEKGYFSDFNPSDPGEYYIEVDVANVNQRRSHNFYIADHLFQLSSSKLVVDYFTQVRANVDPCGEYLGTCSANHMGGPTRDSQAWLREAIVDALLYASNPSLFDRWDNFGTDFANNGRADLIDLLLWHADFCWKYRSTYPGGICCYFVGCDSYDYKDTIDQIVAFIVAYHWFLKEKYPNDTELKNKYQTYLQFCRDNWDAYDADKTFTSSDPVNGYDYSCCCRWEANNRVSPPGVQVLINLLMYEVELQEQADGNPNANPDKYLNIARDNALYLINRAIGREGVGSADYIKGFQWCIGWEILALSYFYLKYPNEAPEYILLELRGAGTSLLSLTDNMWDYRKDSNENYIETGSSSWTHMGKLAQLFILAGTLQDKALREKAYAGVDFVFGRNPCDRHHSYYCQGTYEMIGGGSGTYPNFPPLNSADRCWPSMFPASESWADAGCAPGPINAGGIVNDAFNPPFNEENCNYDPSTEISETWGLRNIMWNIALAFSVLDDHQIRFYESDWVNRPTTFIPGDKLYIELHAGLNLDWGSAETGKILLVGESDYGNDSEVVTVIETGDNTGIFRASYPTKEVTGKASPNNGILEVQRNERVTTSYGYNIFKVEDTIISILPIDSKALVTGGSVVSSPAIYDIDGDGYMEIVVGSTDSKVYAWNHDGRLVSGWPQTTDGPVYSSPALGDINGDGDLEIIIGAGNKIYAWNHDGTLVSGWPWLTPAPVISSPSLGDIDGDGDLEIIGRIEDGSVFALYNTSSGW
ncbi:MAG: VCBS repeat-containing protein, partial [Nitrospinae bacterium]|nr:VCBS repeat-containing protein [Nitrospinota bacterium]